jgi:hypothetical protein
MLMAEKSFVSAQTAERRLAVNSKYWSKSEIATLYAHARNKGEEINIIAELTLSDAATIIEILKDAGVYNKKDLADYAICKCGYLRRKNKAGCDRCTFKIPKYRVKREEKH